jgi:hypothetical protein
VVTLAFSRAKRRTEGTISFRISSLFASSSVPSMLTPVVLPPGRAKLAISPESTSWPFATIGIVLVARCAARIAELLRARMTLAFARTSDWASSGNRSTSPSAYRISRRMLRPSTSPSAANASLNPVANGARPDGAAVDPRPCRRSDRMRRVAAAFALWLCAAMPAFAQNRENLPVIGILRMNTADTAEPLWRC